MKKKNVEVEDGDGDGDVVDKPKSGEDDLKEKKEAAEDKEEDHYANEEYIYYDSIKPASSTA